MHALGSRLAAAIASLQHPPAGRSPGRSALPASNQACTQISPASTFLAPLPLPFQPYSGSQHGSPGPPCVGSTSANGSSACSSQAGGAGQGQEQQMLRHVQGERVAAQVCATSSRAAKCASTRTDAKSPFSHLRTSTQASCTTDSARSHSSAPAPGSRRLRRGPSQTPSGQHTAGPLHAGTG